MNKVQQTVINKEHGSILSITATRGAPTDFGGGGLGSDCDPIRTDRSSGWGVGSPSVQITFQIAIAFPVEPCMGLKFRP